MFAFFKKLFGRADVNKDGKVDTQDAKAVAQEVKAAVKKATAKPKTPRTKKAK